jgi:glycosyltransferase involved in cell wall biosynthesis
LRVLHVTSTFPRAPGDPTGPFLADLVAASREAGLEVRVVAPQGAGVVAMDGVRRFRYGPARAEVLAYGGGLLSTARGVGGVMVPPYLGAMAWAGATEARAWRPDVVHAHWWLPGGLAALAAGRFGRAPVVVTLHGSDVAFARRVRPLARAVVRRAAAVTAVSGALADEASELLGVPVTVTAMPVLVSPDATPAGSREGLVAVGRFAPEKGFDVLLDALRITSGHLTLVGDGPLDGALRERAAGLDVEWAGVMARPALHRLLAGAAAVVIPSRREGLGLVAIEAILLGTPVIASFTGGLPEALGAFDVAAPAYGEVVEVPGGLLVPPGHVGALAAALERADTLPAPGPLAVAGAARHRPEAVAQHHLALYRSLVAH